MRTSTHTNHIIRSIAAILPTKPGAVGSGRCFSSSGGEAEAVERDVMEYDVVTVGAGPAVNIYECAERYNDWLVILVNSWSAWKDFAMLGHLHSFLTINQFYRAWLRRFASSSLRMPRGRSSMCAWSKKEPKLGRTSFQVIR